MLRRLAALLAVLVPAALVATLPASADQPPGPSETVTICHQPGTPAEKTLVLPEEALSGHLGHGDTRGACGSGGGGHVPCTQPETTPAVPVDTGVPVDEEEWYSESVATLDGASPTAFNRPGVAFSFALSCPTLAAGADTVAVYLNGDPVPFSALTLAPDRVTVNSGLASGRNEVMLAAQDTFGYMIEAHAVLWAGTFSIPVLVLNETGAAEPGATVVARMADDPAVHATLTADASGRGTFVNLPNRSYNLNATASGNRLATLPISVFDGTGVLRLKGLQPASTVDNNDFSLGTTAGWNVGSAPVAIVPHVEGSPFGGSTTFSFSSLSSLVEDKPKPDRGSRGEHGKNKGDETASAITDAATAAAAAAPDFDLMLGTAGEGQQAISRTFDVEPGVKSVTIRYRFITSEVPGGWFGSEFNDFYNVSIRAQAGGDSLTDGNSMNGLGLGAFDGGGATTWREAELDVAPDGDTVQFDVAVANVADGLFDSQVVVDAVKKKKLTISKLDLKDIDNTSLSYLSASAHTYFAGNTRVHGTITIEGPKDDTLSEVKLEVLENGGLIATGKLATAAASALLNKQFGDAGKLEITTSQLLFEIPASELAAADQAANGALTLRVKAKSSSNEEAEKDGGSKEKLVRYTGTSRYGGRDEGLGGDDWAKPTVKAFIDARSGFSWGDFSNMNGGPFAPHSSHRTGNSADGWFSNYNNRDAATAQTIIGQLNSYGSRITTVYVTFAPGSAFANAIATVDLNDGRHARDVIRNFGGHTTHFHWEVSE